MKSPIRVLVADDHPLIVQGVRYALLGEEDIKVIGGIDNRYNLVEECIKYIPDVVLLDLDMPGPPITETMRYLHQVCPLVRVVILTAHSDGVYTIMAKQLKTDGYVLKDETIQALAETIRHAYIHERIHHTNGYVTQTHGNRGGEYFTPRERQIFDRLRKGWTNGHIACSLNISPNTVKKHVSNIIGKCGVGSREELILLSNMEHR